MAAREHRTGERKDKDEAKVCGGVTPHLWQTPHVLSCGPTEPHKLLGLKTVTNPNKASEKVLGTVASTCNPSTWAMQEF